MMHAAFDEVRRLAFRALDAADAAAGIDEDSAYAVAWLQAVALPGFAILADALDASEPSSRAEGLAATPSTPHVSKLDAAGRSSVFFAPSVIDLLVGLAQSSPDGTSNLEIANAGHPAMLLACAARYCPPGGGITLTWQDVACAVAAGKSCTLGGNPAGIDWLSQESVTVSLTCDVEGADPQITNGFDLLEQFGRSMHDGLRVDRAAYDRVADYAARILVPESELSRETGAGAGLTDND